MAESLNLGSTLQDEFLDDEEFIEYFAKLNHMLRSTLKKKAFELAKKLILKTATQLASAAGIKRGTPAIRSGAFSDDIDIDATLENIIANPSIDIGENLATWDRKIETPGFVVMVDYSYSMRGSKMILAALTVATIAIHFKKHYGVVCFSSDAVVVKSLAEDTPHESVLDRVFDLSVGGLTNISGALTTGFRELTKFNKSYGLLLTDGSWTAGGNPFGAASQFHRLNVIAFPPAPLEKIRLIAEAGQGTFRYIEDPSQITSAIVETLQTY